MDEPPIFTVISGVNAVVFSNVGKFAAVSFDETTGIDTTDDDAPENAEDDA